MQLVVDIGNSFAKFGVFDDEALARRFSVPTAELKEARFEIGEFPSENITRVVVSSVVPEANFALRELSRARFGVDARFVDVRDDFGLRNLYARPERLGIDRLVAASAAAKIYGAPSIVCAFGTATTIDGVNKSKEYLGGVIAPGMRTMTESLFARTSQLPDVEIVMPTTVFGRDTESSIRAGVVFGYFGLVREIVGRMKAELGDDAKIVATGGFAAFLNENLDVFDVVDESLILKGLASL